MAYPNITTTREMCMVMNMQMDSIIYLFGSFTSLSTLYSLPGRVVLCAEETSTYSWSRFLYCKLLTIGNQLPTFPHKVRSLNRRPQR